MTRPYKEEARGGKDTSVQAAEGGTRDEERHYPTHHTKHTVTKRLKRKLQINNYRKDNFFSSIYITFKDELVL